MILQQQQKGFSLVSAIFVIVILAALGGYMVQMSNVQTQSIALTVQGARVYYAARSGIEWGLNNVLDENANPGGNCFATQNFNLDEFSVRVECASSDHPEGGVNQRVYEITSTARYGTLGQASYTQRVIDVRANRAL